VNVDDGVRFRKIRGERNAPSSKGMIGGKYANVRLIEKVLGFERRWNRVGANDHGVKTSAGDILQRAFFPRSYVDRGSRSQPNKSFKKFRNENDARIVGRRDTKRRVASLRLESLTKNGAVYLCKYFAYGDEEAVGSGAALIATPLLANEQLVTERRA
jgi:hypothetical protein